MTNKDYIPRTFAGLASFLTNLLNKVSSAQSRLGIPAAELALLQTAINAFLAANAIADNPSATNVERLARQHRADEARAVTREFVNLNLRYNRSMTDEDREDMGLTIPDHNPTPVPVPTTYPKIKVDTSIIMRLTLHIQDNEAQNHAKPNGVHGCEIRWAILDTPPTGTEDLLHSAFSTKPAYTFEFDDPQRGKRFYFRCRWENTKGEKGPWCEFGNSIIP